MSGLSVKEDIATAFYTGARLWMAIEVLQTDSLRLTEDPPARIPRYEFSADIWSFGLVLLFMFTAKYHMTSLEFLRAEFRMIHQNAKFPEPMIPAGLPPLFDSIIKDCLDPDPTRRPRSADLLSRFQDALTASSEPRNPVMAIERAVPKKRTLVAPQFCEMPTPRITLSDYVKKHHPLSHQMSLYIAQEIGARLAYLESKRIAHRELRPTYVLVGVLARVVCFKLDGPTQGQEKLCGYGLAKQGVPLHSHYPTRGRECG